MYSVQCTLYTISVILKKIINREPGLRSEKNDINSSGQGMQFDICWDRSIWGNRARNPLSLFSRNCNEGSSLLARWGNIYPSPESRQIYLHTNPYNVTEICQTDESTFNLLFKANAKTKKLGENLYKYSRQNSRKSSVSLFNTSWIDWHTKRV